MIQCLRNFSTVLDRYWLHKLYAAPLHSITCWFRAHTQGELRIVANVSDVFLENLEELQTRGALLCLERRKRPRRKPNAWVMQQDAEHVERLYCILKSLVNKFECCFRYFPLKNGLEVMPMCKVYHNMISIRPIFTSAIDEMKQMRRALWDRAVLCTLACRNDEGSKFALLPREIISWICTFISRPPPKRLAGCECINCNYPPYRIWLR